MHSLLYCLNQQANTALKKNWKQQFFTALISSKKQISIHFSYTPKITQLEVGAKVPFSSRAFCSNDKQ